MFKKILVPVDIDYPNAAKAVYQQAAKLAGYTGAELKLVSVMPDFGMPIVASYVTEAVRNEAYASFNESMQKFITENCDQSVDYTVRAGKNWEQIISTAEKWGADLIVVYHNHRREINEVFSRSCSQRVSDNATCSVLRLRNIRGEASRPPE